MSKKSDQVPEEKLEQYRNIIDAHPDLELKGGKKLPYTSHNGHMFTMLSKAGEVGIRLGKADREAFLEKYQDALFVTYGTTMKEYVAIPDELLNNPDELRPYLDMSYAYVQTLKPKPTKKKSK